MIDFCMQALMININMEKQTLIISLSKNKAAKIPAFSEVIQSSNRVITKEIAKPLGILEAALPAVKYGYHMCPV